MPRTFAGVMLLALGLLSGTAVAGPPEGVSGKMVFGSEVADALCKFRAERNVHARVKWLRNVAAYRDPRVGVALGEVLDIYQAIRDRTSMSIFCDEEGNAAELLQHYYMPPRDRTASAIHIDRAKEWWDDHKADLRRRAAQLPR
jgi:hypothetical protein